MSLGAIVVSLVVVMVATVPLFAVSGKHMFDLDERTRVRYSGGRSEHTFVSYRDRTLYEV